MPRENQGNSRFGSGKWVLCQNKGWCVTRRKVFFFCCCNGSCTIFIYNWSTNAHLLWNNFVAIKANKAMLHTNNTKTWKTSGSVRLMFLNAFLNWKYQGHILAQLSFQSSNPTCTLFEDIQCLSHLPTLWKIDQIQWSQRSRPSHGFFCHIFWRQCFPKNIADHIQHNQLKIKTTNGCQRTDTVTNIPDHFLFFWRCPLCKV